MTTEPHIIIPDWPAPDNVRAAITTRIGGFSQAPFDSFNLALHVADDPNTIERNRQLLQQSLALPTEPQWLNQIHGVDIVEAQNDGVIRDADGSYSGRAGRICLVQTADCLPILLCNQEGTEVAAIHAGWRGLAAGVVANSVTKFKSPNLIAYLGPAISQANFEVGADVYSAFLALADRWCLGEGGKPIGEQAIKLCFQQSQVSGTDQKKWHADLYGLARLALNGAGVDQVFGGDYCTYADLQRFYSYRREGETGRMASLIWRQS